MLSIRPLLYSALLCLWRGIAPRRRPHLAHLCCIGSGEVQVQQVVQLPSCDPEIEGIMLPFLCAFFTYLACPSLALSPSVSTYSIR